MALRLAISLSVLAFVLSPTSEASAMTLKEAVEHAVRTAPTVAAARANRRATTFELRQAQGRFLPQVVLDAEFGQEKIDRPEGFAPDVNDQWRTRRQAAITLRQALFDGWDRANDVYKNAARVDAAAFRVLARSEALGLEAIEAFVDVQRHMDVLVISRRSVERHRQILRNVLELERAGRVARSEPLQVEERLAEAEAAVARVRQSLLEAQAKFRRVVGLDPVNLTKADQPPDVPLSREQAVALGLAENPLLSAAEADVDTAHGAFAQTRSAFFPQVSFEFRSSRGENIAGTPGRDDETLGRVVLTWTLFDGFIIRNRRHEFAERWAQALAERDDRVRLVAEEVERAIAARTTSLERLEVLRRQATTALGVVSSYEEEYRAAKRSLLDLLDAESTRFNSEVELTSAEAIHLFSGYRVLGAMGRLLLALGITPPPEANAIQRMLTHERGPFAVDLPPLR